MGLGWSRHCCAGPSGTDSLPSPALQAPGKFARSFIELQRYLFCVASIPRHALPSVLEDEDTSIYTSIVYASCAAVSSVSELGTVGVLLRHSPAFSLALGIG